MRIVNNNPVLNTKRITSRFHALNGRLARAQERAVTGVAVDRPSDAPGRWSSIHGTQSERADHDVWQKNMDRANNFLDVAESVLGSASDTVQRAWERALQLANENYDDKDRAAGAAEVAGLRDELIGYANTTLGDRSLFAGDAWDGAAFDSSGTYLGSAATQQAWIGHDSSVATALDGSSIFNGAHDPFAALDALQVALAANDPDAVFATLDELRASHRQLVAAREEIGHHQERVLDAGAVSEGLAQLLDERFNAAVAIDPAEAYSELAALNTSYEAALQVTAQSSGVRLFGMLR